MSSSIIRYSLEIVEHEDYGCLGIEWLDSGRPYFDPATNATQLAHDILEHPLEPQPNGLVDEFMALGGIYYLRYQTGYLRQSPRSSYERVLNEQDFIEDTVYLLESDFDYEIPNPGRKIPHNCEVKEQFIAFIKEGIKQYYKERKESWGYVEKVPGYYKTSLANYMVMGYRLTQKRFPNRYDGLRVFERIEQVIHDWFIYNQVEGTEATLVIDYTTGTVELEYPEDVGCCED